MQAQYSIFLLWGEIYIQRNAQILGFQFHKFNSFIHCATQIPNNIQTVQEEPSFPGKLCRHSTQQVAQF